MSPVHFALSPAPSSVPPQAFEASAGSLPSSRSLVGNGLQRCNEADVARHQVVGRRGIVRAAPAPAGRHAARHNHHGRHPRHTEQAKQARVDGDPGLGAAEAFADNFRSLRQSPLADAAQHQRRAWLRDLARSYAEWTAVANGRNLKPRDRVEWKPSDWNVAYFNLVVRCLPGLAEEGIKQLALDRIRSLPDESFFDATGYFLRSVDRVYFGNGGLAEAEAVRIRASLAERLSETPDWRSRSSDPSRSIEVHMGSAIAAFFFNNWDRLPPSSCYLLAPGIARIEPFLPVLERLVIEGPGGFVAGLVLDLVEVSPKPEHLSFITTAAEIWLTEHPDNTIFWVDNEVARRLCVVVERIGTREPYSAWDPLLRDRVGHILSALVGLGVPLAGQLEQDVAGSSDERR